MKPEFGRHVMIPDCHRAADRHKHHFTPAAGIVQRCACSHTKWVITLGGAIPATVACAKCGNQNRTATAYVRGYVDGLVASVVSAVGFP